MRPHLTLPVREQADPWYVDGLRALADALIEKAAGDPGLDECVAGGGTDRGEQLLWR